jgi:hypothetical protein
MSKLTYAILPATDDLSPWDAFVSRSPQGTLFCRSWWLTAAFGHDFDVLAATRAGEIVAGMPLPYAVSGKRKRVVSPAMTTTMGVLFSPSLTASGDYEKQLSTEMDVLSGLVAAIPPNEGFSAAFHPSFTNWLPFYWQNYGQTTCYTYVLENTGDFDALVRKMHHSKRKNLARAQTLVSIERNITAASFYKHHKMTLEKEGKVISYSAAYLERIVDAARLHANIELLAAVDPSGAVHSAIIVLYDRVSAYYIASSIDPDYRNSGSTTLLLVEAMRAVFSITSRFDFEGSMIPGVEQSFRRFGARQVPYFVISREEGLRPKIRIALERLARKAGIKE